jgi:hypothetical protein
MLAIRCVTRQMRPNHANQAPSIILSDGYDVHVMSVGLGAHVGCRSWYIKECSTTYEPKLQHRDLKSSSVTSHYPSKTG